MRASFSVRVRMRWLSRNTRAMQVITRTRQAAVSSRATTLTRAKWSATSSPLATRPQTNGIATTRQPWSEGRTLLGRLCQAARAISTAAAGQATSMMVPST